MQSSNVRFWLKHTGEHNKQYIHGMLFNLLKCVVLTETGQCQRKAVKTMQQQCVI